MAYLQEVTCDVCGEIGIGTFSAAVAAWDPHCLVRHLDRRICRQVLAEKARKEVA